PPRAAPSYGSTSASCAGPARAGRSSRASRCPLVAAGRNLRGRPARAASWTTSTPTSSYRRQRLQIVERSTSRRCARSCTTVVGSVMANRNRGEPERGGEGGPQRMRRDVQREPRRRKAAHLPHRVLLETRVDRRVAHRHATAVVGDLALFTHEQE